ncbi:MAG: tail fiber domain-containing protein, partial [Methylophagaceae bacterium]
LTDVSQSRVNLGVDLVGTDNSTDVTLAGSYNYLTIADQAITLGQVDASADISNLTTSNVTEGTNLYYTDAKVKTKLNTETVVSSSAQITNGSSLVSSSIQVFSGGDISGSVDNLTVQKVQGVALTSAEATQLANIGSETISSTQWEYLGASNQGITTTSDVTFNTGSFKDLKVSDAYASNPLIKLTTTDSSNVEVEMRTATAGYNPGIGVVTDLFDFNIFTNNLPRFIISSTGNVGIGVTPKASSGNWQHFQMGGTGNIITRQADSVAGTMYADNFYINASNADKRLVEGGSSLFAADAGVAKIKVAPPGAADGTISWTTALTVSGSAGHVGIAGDLGIGTPTLPTDIYVASGGGYATLGIGQSSFLASYKSDDSIELCQNTYVNTAGANRGIIASVPASRLTMVDGQFVFSTLVTAADKSQTPTNVMYINPAGTVGIGTNTPDMNGWGANHAILGISTPTAGKSSQLNLRGNSDETADVTVGTIGFLDSTGTGAGATVANITVKSATGTASRPGSYMRFDTNEGAASATPAQERMRISNVGVISFNAYGAGTLSTNSSGVITASSDGSLKTEVNQEIPGLSKIMQLQPKAYTWNNEDTERIELGFFANEVKDVIPEAAPLHNNGLYGLFDRGIIVALTKGMQEQQTLIESQKSLIDNLTSRIETLEG